MNAAPYPPAAANPIAIRWLLRDDLDQVVALERRAFASPWLRRDFVALLRARNSLGQVAVVDDRLVGYVVRTVRGQSLTIDNLAVAPEWRRRGVGRALVRHSCRARGGGLPRIVLADVREQNTPAQLFFRAVGFSCREILTDWYDDTDEPAYRFVWDGELS